MKIHFLPIQLAGLVMLHAPVYAQDADVTHYESGFTEKDYYYPITQVPMTRPELELFAYARDLLSDMAKKTPGRDGYLPNTNKDILLSVKFNVKGQVLVNLDKKILLDESEKCCNFMEDFSQLFGQALMQHMEKKLKKEIPYLPKITFDGYDLGYYDSTYGHEQVPVQQNNLSPQSLAAPTAAGSKVLASAGHGLYYHYGFKKWTAQRDPFYGITEDFLTPVLVDKLNGLLKQRSKATTYLVRELPSSSAIHTPSKKPWWQVSARYYIQKLLPNRKDIWNSKASSPRTGQVERLEDINTRPKYANYLGADLLSIHINASNPHTARGTKVFYDPKLPSNKLLATSITCYMDELIHSVPAYKNFPMSKSPISASDKVESSIPTKPNAIVETAFHDNPADAAALKDANFQTAAMKGVEKGYRLFKENQPCKHFEIDSVPSPRVPNGQWGNIDIKFVGYPQFPVKAMIEFVDCSNCTSYNSVYDIKQVSPLKSEFFCSGPANLPTRTKILKYKLVDQDGVTTKPFTFKVTCTQH